MSSTPPALISVIVPCLNEAKFITGCIESILAFDLPSNTSIEVFIIDGGSIDNTRQIVQEFAKKDERIQLLDNPKRTQVCALNIGFRKARGQWVLRLDAHATYPKNYLLLCYETALRTQADNVGGLCLTLPRGAHYQAMLVQALTTHKFGVGDSSFRIGATEGEADTVPYGFFRRNIVEKIGWFDERLVRAQDYEFNRRLLAAGGKIWLNPAIQLKYYNQPDLFSFYKKQIFWEAPYNAYMWYVAPYAFALRHSVTAIFAAGILGGIMFSILLSTFAPHIAPWLILPFGTVILFYLLLAFLSAIQQSIRYKQPLHILTLPICFFLYHLLHGLGVLWGLLRLITNTAPVQQIDEPWPGAARRRAWPNPNLTGA